MTKAIVRKDVRKFTVKRSKWLRGNGGVSQLLNNEGKMCCLGFYGRECGLRPQDIRDQATPSDVDDTRDEKIWNTFLIKDDTINTLNSPRDSKAAVKLMRINDSKALSDEKREEKLTAEFLKWGIKVKFVE